MLGATQVPVVLSAAFGYKDMNEWLEVARGKAKGHIYTRNSNPTIHVFEEKVRLLEDAEAATSAASGMGIISFKEQWKRSWPHRRPAVTWNAHRKNALGWESLKG